MEVFGWKQDDNFISDTSQVCKHFCIFMINTNLRFKSESNIVTIFEKNTYFFNWRKFKNIGAARIWTCDSSILRQTRSQSTKIPVMNEAGMNTLMWPYLWPDLPAWNGSGNRLRAIGLETSIGS